MSGWGHTLQRLNAVELAELQEREDKQNADPERVEWLARFYKGAVVYWTECSGPKCHERPEFKATYRYVTGRAGRTSYARKLYCPSHAEKFAAKHGLEMPVAS